jgi:hypothetical protein
MKIALVIATSCFLICSSCENRLVTHSALLEYRTDGEYHSYNGKIRRYSVYVNSVKKGNLWHLYEENGQFSVWSRDTGYLKIVYDYPAFNALLKVTPSGSSTKTYNATAGQFHMVGLQDADLTGDFHFKFKNEANPLDSLMITAGFFRIYLEFADTTLVN